ncbi:MAG: FliM/FliN family flagellar motor switch protein [Planctomycetales bacterium]
MTDETSDLLDQAEIDSLLHSAVGTIALSDPPEPADDRGGTDDSPAPFPQIHPHVWQPFDGFSLDQETNAAADPSATEIELDIELGRTELSPEAVRELSEGGMVTFDQLAGDPVDILVGGRLLARGEVLVMNGKFCVRISEILSEATFRFDDNRLPVEEPTGG